MAIRHTTIIFILIIFLAVPAYSAWETPVKDVAIGEMGFSLSIPQGWSVTPDDDGFKEYSKIDADILCRPVLVEDDGGNLSIFIYATKRDDFQGTVMDKARERSKLESDVLKLGETTEAKLVDAEGNEYTALRNLHLVAKKDLVYGVIFHKDDIRY